MPKPIRVCKVDGLWMVSVVHGDWLSQLPFPTWEDAIRMTTILTQRSRELSVITAPMATTRQRI